MAALGYVAAIGNGKLDHDEHHKIFFAYGTWWAQGDDGSSDDYFLYEWDKTTPGSYGSTGGWAKAKGPGGSGTVNFDTTDSTRLALWFDESTDKLHVLRMRASGADLYDCWLYQSGTNSWTTSGGVAGESTGATVTGVQYSNIAVDSNGVVWMVYNSGGNFDSQYRSGGSWSAGPRVAAGGVQTPAMCAFIDSAGDPCIGALVVVSGSPSLRWYWRKDSDSAAAAWSYEDLATGGSYDDHVSVQAYVFSGDTASTICTVNKNGVNNQINAYMRRADGVWVSATNIFSVDRTRPRVVIDATNKKFYVVAPFVGGAVRSVVSDISSSLSFGSETVVVDPDAAGTGQDCGAPQSPVTSTTGLMVFGEATASTPWWNLLTIASAGATVDLAATPTAQSTAAADLLKGVTLSAAALSVGSAAAGMSLSVPLAGNAQAVASATGGLQVTVNLAAGALAAAVATAAIALGKPLAADGQSQASATADLSTSGSVDLAADAQAVASAGATLSLTVSLSADAVAVAVATAEFAGAATLAAAAIAQAQATAALSVGKELAAAGQGQASAGATITLQVPLTAAALAQAAGTASLSLAVNLAASALGQASASASFAGIVSLASAGQAVASATAALTVRAVNTTLGSLVGTIFGHSAIRPAAVVSSNRTNVQTSRRR